MIKVTLTLLLCATLIGCTTNGEYVKAEEATSLQETVSNATELEEALGPPSVTIPRNDGKIKWVYEGVFQTADATSYIPYVGLIIGRNNQRCTRLSVLVDKETGNLSDWVYLSEKDSDHWANTDEKCIKADKD